METAMDRQIKTKEIHAIETTEQQSPAAMIRFAITSGADLEKLEKLLVISRQWEADEARKAYHKAMTAFKADPPSIEKDKHVAFKDVRYNHASLANVTDKINEALSRHGLSASWKVSQNGTVSVTCKITHEQGHSEETTLSAPADQSGSKNAIQAIGSTISYLERYSLLALTGLATHEADDDAMGAAGTISLDDARNLVAQINENKIDLDLFLKYMGVNKVEDIARDDLKKAQAAIDSSKARKAAVPVKK